MATYERILVALDQTPLSATVFEQACALAQQKEAQLMLIHCFTLPQPNRDFGDRYRANLSQFLTLAQEQIDAGMEAVRQWLSSYAHDAEGRGLQVDWDWRMGDPGRHICAAAKDWKADLIMVGRRGHQGLTEVLLGSVSNYVVHHARCSVLVVQEQPPAQ